jgi:AraC-like DNA-binding protein
MSAMLEPRSLADFRTRPYGGYVAGRRWIYFSFDADLFGFSLWGSPEPDDMRGLIQVMELELDRPWHAGLVEVTHVDGFDAESFAVLSSYVIRNAARLGKIISHTAMVRSRGLFGALATGFFGATASPFPVSFWDDPHSALQHLGSPDPARRAAALATARRVTDETPAELRATRLYLAAHLTDPSIAEAARAAGVSLRTFQRRLGTLSTSFAAEVIAARVRVAERLLRDTDQSITEIAFLVGCSSAQHLSTLFRKARGETPTAFRARARESEGARSHGPRRS